MYQPCTMKAAEDNQPAAMPASNQTENTEYIINTRSTSTQLQVKSTTRKAPRKFSSFNSARRSCSIASWVFYQRHNGSGPRGSSTLSDASDYSSIAIIMATNSSCIPTATGITTNQCLVVFVFCFICPPLAVLLTQGRSLYSIDNFRSPVLRDFMPHPQRSCLTIRSHPLTIRSDYDRKQ
jgi:hypothetical protein